MTDAQITILALGSIILIPCLIILVSELLNTNSGLPKMQNPPEPPKQNNP